MANPKHLNNGKCAKCLEIMGKYPNFHKPLQDWFFELQSRIPDAHIAYAGRGKIDQEDFFAKGTSKAHYGESPHNYNLAIDFFQLTNIGARWDLSWFKDVINPEIKKSGFLTHGLDFKSFRDAPHCEVTIWRDMIKTGTAKLVE